MKIPKEVQLVIDELERLPGVGPRSAERLTFHLMRIPENHVQALSSALTEMRSSIQSCGVCFNISSGDTCEVCLDLGREESPILVVEEPLDVIALEKTGIFKGKYHVLGGVINPVKGIGPEELRVNELLGRIRKIIDAGSSVEVILATNPSTEGETTALYIKRLIEQSLGNLGVSITRIARGLPVGGDVEYADPVTLSRSLEGRVSF